MFGWFEWLFLRKERQVMTVVDPPLILVSDIPHGETFILPDEPSRGVCLRCEDHNGVVEHPPGTYLFVTLKDGKPGRRDGAAVGVVIPYECVKANP